MTTISQNGGIVYIRENSSNIQWSSNNSTWNIISSWPVTVTNTAPSSSNILKVLFTTNITLTGGTDRYIQVGSNYIQFGSDTLNPDGSRPIITISGITNYPGLIKNYYTTFTDTLSYSNINIYNLVVNSDSSTLANSQGWIGQRTFGVGGSDNNYIINCHSDGDISENGGGIIGDLATLNGGTLYVIGCSSSGSIAAAGGGIIGGEAGRNDGIVFIRSCWSQGIINGGGGIVGSNSFRVNIQNCYSIGGLNGPNSGGIVGSNAGLQEAIVQNCYSTGPINGANSGGICGSLSPGASETCSVIIQNCYSTGNINNPFPSNIGGGGICGVFSGDGTINLTINNCYVTGTVVSLTGYFIGSDNAVNGTGSGFIISNSYSEAYNGSSGWKDINANSTLFDTPSPGSLWITIGQNLPYELFNMGYTPYSTTNISSTPNLIRTSAATVIAGYSTNSAIKTFGVFYTPLFDYTPLSINPATGVISTTPSTVPGTYTLYIYNTGSYNVTTFTLTVLPNIPEQGNPCCQNTVCIQNAPTTNKSNELYNTFKSGREITNNVNRYYNNINTNQSQVYVKPVFGSYREYMLYLQTKNKLV